MFSYSRKPAHEPKFVEFATFARAARGARRAMSSGKRSFYRDAQGAMLVFDVASKASLEALDKWLKEAEEFGMDTRRGTALVLVGNKADAKRREVSEADARRWASSHGGMNYVETSAKEGANVCEMFEKLFMEAAKSMR